VTELLLFTQYFLWGVVGGNRPPSNQRAALTTWQWYGMIPGTYSRALPIECVGVVFVIKCYCVCVPGSSVIALFPRWLSKIRYTVRKKCPNESFAPKFAQHCDIHLHYDVSNSPCTLYIDEESHHNNYSSILQKHISKLTQCHFHSISTPRLSYLPVSTFTLLVGTVCMIQENSLINDRALSI